MKLQKLIKILKENYNYNPKYYLLMIGVIFTFSIIIFAFNPDLKFKVMCILFVVLQVVTLNWGLRSEVYNQKITDLLKEKGIRIETLQEKVEITKYEFGLKKGKYEFYVSNKEKKKYMRLLESM
ncbi:hypothetical protein [Mammaliicoccus vitulinus]|uniref:hypothetical protein n=1 Tax=Mammaliicoccus vitulinus TaxID=71237 RepID=UPI0028D5C2BC|nr:hypothetical protein [Mammaliicoccus vitulinus]